MNDFAIRIEGFRGVQVAISATAVTTGDLERGVYDCWADVDCWIRVKDLAADADDVTTSNGYKIAAGNVVPVMVDGGRQIGIIAGGAGTFNYHRTG